MKIILKTIAFQFLILIFHRGVSAQVLNPDDLSVILEKIQQYSAPLRTLELEFLKESEHNGILKPEKQTYRVKIDFQKNLARWENFSPARKNFPYEIWTYDFFDNGVSTSIATSTKKSANAPGSNFPVTRVRIGRYELPFLTELEVIIQYNAVIGPGKDSPKPKFQILHNGKFPLDTKIKNIIYNNEPSLEVSPNAIAKKDKGKHELIFSKKTGALLKNTSLVGDEVDGKIVDRFMNSYNYSNFTVYKGILFPLKMILEYSNTVKDHITIKKESLRINEPIDPNEFSPKIPGDSNVIDEIKGIEYTTPVFGNAEATKELEKELDAYFKSADDVK